MLRNERPFANSFIASPRIFATNWMPSLNPSSCLCGCLIYSRAMMPSIWLILLPHCTARHAQNCTTLCQELHCIPTNPCHKLDAFIASLFMSLWLLDLQQSNDAVHLAAFAAPLHCPTCSEMNDPLSIASLRPHLSLPQIGCLHCIPFHVSAAARSVAEQ
jgi:hypothetical protein